MKLLLILAVVPFLLLVGLGVHGQPHKLIPVVPFAKASFRGMSVVDDHVAWVSGSKGTVARSTDGGRTWETRLVSGFENLDFRSLYAFDEDRAVIANAGYPGYVLRTADGGKNWMTVYSNDHPQTFFDGIDFWDSKDGIIYGDPIDGRMLLLRTADGGANWTEVSGAPLLEKGEASFAASGTGIRCTNEKDLTICTGGSVSRLWVSKNKGEHWSSIHIPIIQGKSTTGIFSFIQNKEALIIVGGDFQNASLTANHNFYSLDGGKQWLTPTTSIRGYRECVEAIANTILIATGPSGTDISYDNGIRWKALSEETGLHVVRKARNGSLVILAGNNGHVFLLR